MAQLSAYDQLRLSEAVAVFFRLLSFDRAWTALALRPEPLTAEDVDGLTKIAGELRDLIGQTVEAAYTVASVASIAQPPDELGDGIGMPQALRAFYNAQVAAGGGVVTLAQQTSEGLREIAADEQLALDNQLETLRDGGRVDGDLSRRFMCRFAKILMLAGGVTVWVPPHAHAVASLGAGSTIALANRCWELEPFFQSLAGGR